MQDIELVHLFLLKDSNSGKTDILALSLPFPRFWRTFDIQATDTDIIDSLQTYIDINDEIKEDIRNEFQKLRSNFPEVLLIQSTYTLMKHQFFFLYNGKVENIILVKDSESEQHNTWFSLPDQELTEIAEIKKIFLDRAVFTNLFKFIEQWNKYINMRNISKK